MSKVYLTQCSQFTARHGHGGTLAEDVHEHTFHYAVTFYGPTNAEGYLIDFRVLMDTFEKEINAHLAGKTLNTLFENPTTEVVCEWIFDTLQQKLPHLFSVKLAEEPDRWIEYRGEK